MREQSDQALRASLRKVYGSTPAMRRTELRRRLLAIPEFFYFADELIDESLTRGLLRSILESGDDRLEAGEGSDWLEITGVSGNLDAWP